MQDSDTDLKSVSNKFLQVLKELETVKEWEQLDDKPVRVCKIERGQRVIARAEIVINLPFQTIAKYFDDAAFMKKISDRIADLQVLKKQQGFSVVHVHMKGFAMVSDREMVVVFTYHKEGNKLYFGNRSCDYPCKPYPDTVRAFAHCGGYILEKTGQNSSRLVNIMDVDPNGSIPDFVKKKMAIMRASTLTEIEQKIKASQK